MQANSYNYFFLSLDKITLSFKIPLVRKNNLRTKNLKNIQKNKKNKMEAYYQPRKQMFTVALNNINKNL